MKKNLFIIAIAIIAFCSCFMACKKEVVKTNKDYIEGFKWKRTAETNNGKNNMTSYSACELDNLFIWSAGKTTVDEGATKCSPTDPQSEVSGTYTFSADFKTISEKDPLIPGFSLDFTILEATETTLKLQTTFIGTQITTYTRQ